MGRIDNWQQTFSLVTAGRLQLYLLVHFTERSSCYSVYGTMLALLLYVLSYSFHQRTASFIFSNTVLLLIIPHIFNMYFHTLFSHLTIFSHSFNTPFSAAHSHLYLFFTFMLFYSFIQALATKTNSVWPADSAYPPLHCLLYWKSTPEGERRV